MGRRLLSQDRRLIRAPGWYSNERIVNPSSRKNSMGGVHSGLHKEPASAGPTHNLTMDLPLMEM